MTDHRIVYPVERVVTEDFIQTKYCDAVANGELRPGIVGIEAIKKALEDIGVVTFA